MASYPLTLLLLWPSWCNIPIVNAAVSLARSHRVCPWETTLVWPPHSHVFHHHHPANPRKFGHVCLAAPGAADTSPAARPRLTSLPSTIVCDLNSPSAPTGSRSPLRLLTWLTLLVLLCSSPSLNMVGSCVLGRVPLRRLRQKCISASAVPGPSARGCQTWSWINTLPLTPST